MNEPLGPDELASILRREYDAADHYYDQIEPLMEAAFRFYEAQPFGNEVEGRSQIVLPDVQEVVDDTTADIVEMFTAGDRTIEFEATDEADEEVVDDATAAIDYRFMREQDGYRVIHDIAQDGKLRKYGVFKTLCDYEEKVSREWQVVPLEALELVVEQIEADDGEVEQVREAQDPETGEPIARILIKTQRTEKKHKIVAVPNKEYRFNPLAKHEDTSPYNAHVRLQTRSDLVAMGFDPEQVYGLPTHNEWEDTESEQLDYHTGEVSNEALEEVLLCEEYARIDVDGDGIAELVKCYRVENEILRWAGNEQGEEGELAIETVDEQPFSVYCPFPRSHRLVGYSLAEKVMDIQLGRSEMARQLFDGMAFANMPRPIVAESGSSDETLDDILNPIPGSPIRVRDQSAVTMATNTFDVGKSLQAMEWFSREKEARSGNNRATPGADPDTLNNLSATEFVGREDKGQRLKRFMARNMAEAFGRSCAKLYRRMRIEGEPFTIKVNGKYRKVDPSTWPESVNMVVRVGLGTNSKDKRIQARMALQEPLVLLKQEGLAGPEHIFKWMDGVARDMGIGQGDDFMYNPDDPEAQEMLAQQQQQPDPEVAAKQAEMQAKQQEAQARLQLDAQKAEASAQLDREKAQAQIETDREKHAMQMQAAREKHALDSQLARDKASAEIELSRERMAAEIQLQRERNAREADLQQNRPGGSLAE